MRKRNLFAICALCLLTAGGSLVFAQGGPPRGNGGPGQPPALPDSSGIVEIVDEMAEALSLTDDQKSRVSELHFAHFAAAEKVLGASRGDREGTREAMDDLRRDFEADVKEILTDEQQEAFDELSASRRGRSGGPGRRR